MTVVKLAATADSCMVRYIFIRTINNNNNKAKEYPALCALNDGSIDVIHSHCFTN